MTWISHSQSLIYQLPVRLCITLFLPPGKVSVMNVFGLG
jgi:hypothetical protein